MIYVDNSATTHIKPKEVIKAVTSGLTRFSANPGRGGHKFAIDAAIEVAKVREKVKSFIGAPKSSNVIFTSGCTEALNLAILGTIHNGGHVIATCNEHNSVLRPLFHLKNQGLIDLSIATPQNNTKLTRSDIEKHIKSNTYMICVNHISNVDGMIADIDEIGELCAEKCIIFLVDAAQSCGHIKIDMIKSNIDLLALAPHKGLYAPQGIGILAFSQRVTLSPIKFGGTGTESYSTQQPKNAPECFESGTVATPNILGLGAGINFVEQNFTEIERKIEDLTTYLNFELRKIPEIICYTHPDNHHGVIAFNIKSMESEQVCQILNDNFKIYARSGLQCAPLKHKHLGTLNTGIVRISLSYYNTFGEIIFILKAIRKICSKDFTVLNKK